VDSKLNYFYGEMIMDLKEAKALTAKYAQTHLLEYYDELTESQKVSLLSDIEKIDFNILNCGAQSKSKPLGEITPIDALTKEDIEKNRAEYEKVGSAAIKAGKVAAVLLAGGQGTRLGSDKPKGMFDMGITRELSIFKLQFDNILSVSLKVGAPFHVFVMTSDKTDKDTREFFKDKAYFGYPKEYIHFYIQNVAPTCSEDGKIFLDEKYKVSFSPNGNGGWYSSLINAGLGNILTDGGVEWLNVYSVDNVLQKICDPIFVGATILSGAACSSKVVKKACPEERVGVMCKENGRPKVVEYYEMPEALASKRDNDGQLTYRFGVILNYLFAVDGLNGIYKNALPYHMANKAIAHIEHGQRVIPTAPNGYKFETLVVDMVAMMGNCLAFEVERERQFAPVKNKTGTDSVETARTLLINNGVQL
jgi:UDP-N-acetylglucosamine/UDP-N-acetylgalactosamine diphosphorylase